MLEAAQNQGERVLAAERDLPFPSLWKTRQALNPLATEPALPRRSALPVVRGASQARGAASRARGGAPHGALRPPPPRRGGGSRVAVSPIPAEPAWNAGRGPHSAARACPAGLAVRPSLERGAALPVRSWRLLPVPGAEARAGPGRVARIAGAAARPPARGVGLLACLWVRLVYFFKAGVCFLISKARLCSFPNKALKPSSPPSAVRCPPSASSLRGRGCGNAVLGGRDPGQAAWDE